MYFVTDCVGQCYTNIFEYSNIRILDTEYSIFEYEYWFSLVRIYSNIRISDLGFREIFDYSNKFLEYIQQIIFG